MAATIQERLGPLFRSQHARAFAVLLLLAGVLFSPFFLHGEAFLGADNLSTYYPWRHYAPPKFRPHNTLLTDPVDTLYAGIYNRDLKAGHISAWAPYILTGVPGAMGGPGPYHPLKIVLHRFFPTYAASTLFLFAHVTFMGLFMYLYLFQIGAGWRGALFGAIAYMFNGCAMVWLEFEQWVTAFAYLPLILFSMERLLDEQRVRFAFVGGIAYGLMLISWTFQLAIYASVFMLFYLAFVLAKAHWNGEGRRGVLSVTGCFAVLVATGVAIGAVEILPFSEVVANSSRISRNFGFHQFFDTLARMPFRYVITLVFPDYFGNPVLGPKLIPQLASHEYMNYNELAFYMGVPAVFAFLACLVGVQNRFSRYYLIMTLVTAGMITGTWLYYPFFALVPGMNKMNPSRVIFLFVFAFAVCSAFGYKALETMSPRRRTVFLGASLAVVTAVALLSVSGENLTFARYLNRELFETVPPQQQAKLVETIQGLRRFSSPAVYKPLLLTLGAFCLFSLLAVARTRKTGTVLFVLTAGLLSYDLISYGAGYNTTSPPETIYRRTPAIEFLLRQPQPFRVVQDTDAGLSADALIAFGLEEVGGYQSMYPDRVNKLLSFIVVGDRVFKGEQFDRWVKFGSKSTNWSSPFFDLLNVRYLLTKPGVRIADGKWRLVFEEDLAVYENPAALPRIYAVHKHAVRRDMTNELLLLASKDFDMRNEVVLEEEPSPGFEANSPAPSYPPKVTVERYLPEEVTVTADLGAKGWLVLSNTYYPGWTAEIDGKPVPLRRANYNFMAAELPAGRHNVSFRYEPMRLRAGMIITVLGSLVAIAGALGAGRLLLLVPGHRERPLR